MAQQQMDTVLRFLVEYAGSEALKRAVRETTELGDVSEGVQKELSRLTSELLKNQGLEKTIQNLKKLSGEFVAYQQNIRQTQEVIKALAQTERDQAQKTRELGTALATARKELETLKQGVKTYTGTSKEFAAAKADLKSKIKELNEEYRKEVREQKNVSEALDKARTEVSKYAESQEKLRPKITKVKEELEKAGIVMTSMSGIQTQLANNNNVLSRSLQTLADSQKTVAADSAKMSLRFQDQSDRALRLAQANRQSAVALEAYKQRAQEASQSTGTLTRSISTAESALSRLRSIAAAALGFLSFRAAADAAKTILTIGDAAERAKIQLTGLYKDANLGNAAFSKLQVIARQNSLNFQSLMESAQKLKSLGLEPLDGTLQAIIDQNARLGGSSETLNRIILALGQAWTKTRLQAEEMRQLVEAGVPAFDLLTKATGKSAQELLKLSEQGRLGRDVIRQLINEMGESTKGAGAQNARLLSGLIAALQDRWIRFAQTVANSGALDYAKRQLTSLRDYIDELARSGKLKEYAQNVSNAMVAVGEFAKSTIQFITEHGEAIKQLAQSYLLFKLGSIITGLAGMALKLKEVAVGGAAVGAAVTRSNGVISSFITLLTRIPKGLFISVALVGLELAINGAERLAIQLASTNEAAESLKKAQEARRKTVEEEAYAYGLARAKLAEYKDVQLQTAAQVASMTELERRSYQTRLEGSKQYLDAKIKETVRLAELGRITEEEANLVYEQARLTKIAFADLAAGIKMSVESAKNGLNGASQEIFDSFKSVRDSAEATQVRLDELFRKFEEVPATKLGDIALGLAAVAESSDNADRNIRNGLLETLSKLTGEQLLKFQSNAIAAFNASGASATRSGKVLDATLLASMEKLGVSPLKFQMGMQEAGRQTVAVFQAIVENARATSYQIETAFKAAIANATSEEELQALGQRLQIAFDSGRVGADAMARATQALKDQVRSLRLEMDPLSDSFAKLGIQSQAALNATRDAAKGAFDAIVQGTRTGAATQEDLKRAFVAYAQTVLDSVKDSKHWEQETTKSQLSVLASTHGLTQALKEMGITGSEAVNEIVSSSDAAKNALDSLADSASSASSGASDLSTATDKAGEALDNFSDRGERVAQTLNGISAEFANAASNAQGLDRVAFNLLQDQDKQFNDALELMRQQNLALDETEQRLVQLRAQYKFLSDERLMQMIQEEDRLKQNQQRRQQELEREKNQQNQQQKEQQSQTSSGGLRRPDPIVVEVKASGIDRISDENAKKIASQVTPLIMSEVARQRQISGGGR